MDKIGKYQILGELGTGDVGTVYKAVDPGMGRPVAIKVLKAQADAALAQRFAFEARTAANLRHRNIVTVFEFGEDHGVQFLVMEHLDGKTLRELIAENAPFSTVEKLHILSEAALGIKAAHENGVLHRDIKPANIMRLADGSVKIMDFGISRSMSEVDTRLTRTGFLVGTPQYMAPEQFTNNADADVLCDIWAFGVVLYEFLTGANPFRAAKPEQVIYLLTAEVPRPLSHTLPDVPPRLEEIAQRLLSKNRSLRFQTMEEARLELQPVILELRHAQIQSLIAAAEMLDREHQQQEIQTLAGRILDLDPTNPWGRKTRDEWQEALRAHSVQERIAQLTAKADAELALDRVESARQLLKKVLKLDPANVAVRRRIEELPVNPVRDAPASQAAAAGQSIPELRPAQPVRDLDALRRNTLGSAARLVLLQSYDEAIRVLKQSAVALGGDPAIQNRLAEVERQYAVHREQKKMEAAIAQGKELLRHANYRQAIDLLRPCAESFPANAEIAQLLSHALQQAEGETRTTQVDAILSRAEALAASGEIDQALNLAAEALALDPASDRAKQIRDRLIDARRRREEASEIERRAADCRAAIQSGAMDEASAVIADLANRFPEHPILGDLRNEVAQNLQQRRDAHEREIREYRQRFEQLLAAGNSDEATVILQELTSRYPTDQQNFAPLFERVATVEREKQEVRAEAERAGELLSAGNCDEATLILRELTSRYPAHQQSLVPLFERAAAIEREKRERRAAAEQARQLFPEDLGEEATIILRPELLPAEPAPGPRPLPRLLWIALAVALLAVVLAFYLKVL